MKNEECFISKRITTKRKTRNTRNTYTVIATLTPNKVLQLTQKYNEILNQDEEKPDRKFTKPTNMISYKIKNNQIYKINCENNLDEKGKPLLKPKPLLIKPTDFKSTIIIKENVDNLRKFKTEHLSANDKINSTDAKDIKENLKPLQFSKHKLNHNISKQETKSDTNSLFSDKLLLQKFDNTKSLEADLQQDRFSKLIDKYKPNNFRETSKFPETFSQIKHLKKTPSFTLRNSDLNYRSVKTVIEIFEKRKSETLKNSFRICSTNENRKIIDTFKKYDTLDSKLTKLRNRHKLMWNAPASSEVLDQSIKLLKPVVPEKVRTNLNSDDKKSGTNDSLRDSHSSNNLESNLRDDTYPKTKDDVPHIEKSCTEQNQVEVKEEPSQTLELSQISSDSPENITKETAISSIQINKNDENKEKDYSSIETTVCPNNSFLWRTKSRESIRLPPYCTESIYEEIQPNKNEVDPIMDKNEEVIYEDIKSQLEEKSNCTNEQNEVSPIYEEIVGNSNKNDPKQGLETENLYDPIGNYDLDLDKPEQVYSNSSEYEEGNRIASENSSTEEYETLSQDSNYEDLDYEKALPKLEQICNEVGISLNGLTNIANYEQIYESLSNDVKQSSEIQSDYKEYGKSLPNAEASFKQELKINDEINEEGHSYYNISKEQANRTQDESLLGDASSLIENDYYMPQSDPDYYNQNNSNETKEETHDITDYENIDDVTAFQDCVLSHNNSLYRKCGWNQSDTQTNENEISSNNWVDINDENADDVNILIIRSRHRHKKRNDWLNRVREQRSKNFVDTNQNIDQESDTSHLYESLPSEDDTDSFDSDSENEFCEKFNQHDSGINMSSPQFLDPPGNSHTLTRLAVSASKQMQKLKNNFSITKHDFTKSLSRITNKKNLKWRASSTNVLHSKNLAIPKSTDDSELIVDKQKRSCSLTALKDSETQIPLIHSENEKFEKGASNYSHRYSLPAERSTNISDVYQNIEFKMGKPIITEKRKKNWLKLKKSDDTSVNKSTFYLATNHLNVVADK